MVEALFSRGQSPEGNSSTNTLDSWMNECISLERGDLGNTAGIYYLLSWKWRDFALITKL